MEGVTSVDPHLSPDLASTVIVAVGIDVGSTGRHRPEHIGQVLPAAGIARVGRGEGALDLPLGAHRTHEEGDPDRASLLRPPTVDVGGDGRTAQVLPLQLEVDARPVRLELRLALT